MPVHATRHSTLVRLVRGRPTPRSISGRQRALHDSRGRAVEQSEYRASRTAALHGNRRASGAASRRAPRRIRWRAARPRVLGLSDSQTLPAATLTLRGPTVRHSLAPRSPRSPTRSVARFRAHASLHASLVLVGRTRGPQPHCLARHRARSLVCTCASGRRHGVRLAPAPSFSQASVFAGFARALHVCVCVVVFF